MNQHDLDRLERRHRIVRAGWFLLPTATLGAVLYVGLDSSLAARLIVTAAGFGMMLMGIEQSHPIPVADNPPSDDERRGRRIQFVASLIGGPIVIATAWLAEF